jgi:hypothetical protein
VRIRSISNVKVAKRVIIGIFIIVYLVYAQMFFCFDGKYESTTSNCYTISDLCELYNSFAPTQHIPNNRNKKKTPTQMTVMLLVQVICSIILSLPISVQNIYTEMTRNFTKSEKQQQIEDFLGTLFVLITLMNSAISFYIFTLTGQIFREELKLF